MTTALIVSKSDKLISFISGMLKRDGMTVLTAISASESRRVAQERDISLCVIDTPLIDDPTGELAIDLSNRISCQVIVLIKNENYDELTSKLEVLGIMTVSKPISVPMLTNTLHLAKAINYRFLRVQEERKNMIQKMDDFKYVNRAKLLLISYLNMSEGEAHRYIEKQAMDLRISKRKVAESILKTYQS